MRRANVHASSCSSAEAHRNARVGAEPTRRRKRFGNRCGARAALKLSSTVERACGAPSARSGPCRPRNAARGDRLWPRHDQKAAEMRALRWSNDRCSAASRCARFKALFLLASPLIEGAIAEIQWTHPPETILPIRLFRGPRSERGGLLALLDQGLLDSTTVCRDDSPADCGGAATQARKRAATRAQPCRRPSLASAAISSEGLPRRPEQASDGARCVCDAAALSPPFPAHGSPFSLALLSLSVRWDLRKSVHRGRSAGAPADWLRAHFHSFSARQRARHARHAIRGGVHGIVSRSRHRTELQSSRGQGERVQPQVSRRRRA